MENKTIEQIVSKIIESFPSVRIERAFSRFDSEASYYYLTDTESACRGFGSARNERVALLKAYAEFVERKSFYRESKADGTIKSTSGFATHVDLISARENAVHELIERDALLVSWLIRHAPYWLSKEECAQFGLGEAMMETFFKCDSAGFEIKLGIVGMTGNIVTAIGAVRSKRERSRFFAIDTCSSSVPANALDSVARAAIFFCDVESNDQYAGNRRHLTEEDLNDPMDHLYYYAFSERDLAWFHEGSKEILSLPMPSIEIQDCSVDNPLGLLTVRAVSDEVQKFFVGPSESSKLNHSRLASLGFSEPINLAPHPLS